MSARNNNNNQSSSQSNDKTKQVRAQVDEVVGIMQNNIEKVVERGEHLDTLQTKTENLQQSSLQFKRGATTLRKQMWWKNAKMTIIIALVVLIILLVIIFGVIVPAVNNAKSATQSN